MKDYYSTRVGKTEVIERQDPVVHSENNHNLSQERLASYRKNGFLFFPSFLSSSTLSSFKKEVREIKNQRENYNRKNYITEPHSQALRSVFNIHLENKLFSKFFKSRQILDVVEDVLGKQIYIHQSRINYKPAFSGKEFYWHSDFETWHAEDGMPRMKALSCSLYLDDNNEFNSPTMVIPGSHRYFISCIGKTPLEHHKYSLKKQEYGVPSGESIQLLMERFGIYLPKGPAGSLLVFDCNLLHGSNSNISPYPRSNLFFVFNREDNHLHEPFAAKEKRPNYLAARV